MFILLLSDLSHERLEMANDEYHYEHLDTTEPSIRLLTLLPRSHRIDGEIALRLRPCALRDCAGSFTAISYTWGTDSPSHRVWVDGKAFYLRNNIWLFLDHCLDPDIGFETPSWIWTDSICIDQSNVSEKNVQVAMMGDIYKQAKDVLIWLDWASQQRLLPAAIRKAWPKSEKHILSIDDYNTSAIAGKFDSALDLTFASASQELMHETYHVYGHRYWSRLWTVQENHLNKDVRVILRDLTVPKEMMGSISMIMTISTSTITSDTDLASAYCESNCTQKHSIGNDSLWEANTFAQWAPQASPATLGSLLASYRSQKCLNPRDVIYGLLGMCQPPIDLRVDYSCSIEDLARSVERIMSHDLQGVKPSDGLYLNGDVACQWPLFLQQALKLNAAIIRDIFGPTCNQNPNNQKHWGEQYRPCKYR